MELIGVDIGGSHISAAKIYLGSNAAEFQDFHEADVDTFGSKESIISAWSEIIKKAAGNATDIKVGIAMPGPYDYGKGISLIKDQGKMASLYQLSVKNLLAESLGIISSRISFTNDAEAFLLGESFAGAGREFGNSIGITLGTGLGSAIKTQDIVKDAKLWTAPFREGIAEDYLGTAWFKKYVAQNYGLEISGVKDLLDKEFDIEVSRRVFETFGSTLGEFLLPYLVENKAEGVVLGGKISLACEYFLPTTQSYLENMGYPVPINISELGERSALIGASL